MSMPPQARREFLSKIAVAGFFFATALAIGCELQYIYPFLPYPLTTTDFVAGVGVLAIPLGFVCACVLVFFRARVAYGLGLAAAAIGLRWLIRLERSFLVSSWSVFNMALEPESWREVLIILSVALIVVSGVCAALRLLPARWTVRKLPLGQRTWPAAAAGFLALGVWLFHAGTPYQIPLIVDAVRPELTILHVEKRGLRFHETAISASRDGKLFVGRTERNLLQYEFETQASKGMMPYERVKTFRKSAQLWKLRTGPAQLLHSWNAEGWYVVDDSKILAFTTENKTAPPQVVVDMFSEMDKLPAVAKWTASGRDVCFGFCYGPMAALGFEFANSFPH
jgi:hypothetical protein